MPFMGTYAKVSNFISNIKIRKSDLKSQQKYSSDFEQLFIFNDVFNMETLKNGISINIMCL